MENFDGVGNLRRSGVRPLRGTVRPRAQEPVIVQSFSVEDLKNGGNINLSDGAINQITKYQNGDQNNQQPTALNPGGESLRQRYQMGSGPAPSGRQSSNSQLTMEEQVEKLEKIRKSAVEYEAVFVDHLVKQMQPKPITEVAGGETLSDIAQQPFRDFLSQAGGLGLADTIVGQVARQEGLEQTLHSNPGIMGPGWRPTIPPNLMAKTAGNLIYKDYSQEQARPSAPVLAEATQTNKSSNHGVGLMSHEEIAYLYRDAGLGAS